ncbi:hypothetical protein C5C94_07310 [Rathayibacter sp. AY1C3]|nr:hypothetical protein C5C52_08875 [Rathayibacter sp. AY1E5]PPH32237.1 hypothetical protein C5C94_07310 [Rathayibacter sp. AY1C3]PPH66343.1 hypothetical protein C5D25_01680 [Rathayibacter sp. AY1D7]PPI31237.1 hypothetical protein C5D66_07695 [Rathayibacter sp. AY1B4]
MTAGVPLCQGGPMTAAEPAPTDLRPAGPAWLPDPERPGFERWWDGSSWSTVSARVPWGSAIPLQQEWTRLVRPAQNRRAAAALVLTRVVGVGIALLLLLLFLGAGATWARWGALLLGVAVVGAAIAGLIVGVLAVRQPATLGGRGAAWFAVVDCGAVLLAILGLTAIVIGAALLFG